MRSVLEERDLLLVGNCDRSQADRERRRTVVKFFPDYSALKSPAGTTSRCHLLTMSSGMHGTRTARWSDPKNDEPHLAAKADPVRYVLSKPIAAAAGHGVDLQWRRNRLCSATFIERVSASPLEAFAREIAVRTLGITDWEWMKYRNEKILAPPASLPPARCRKDRSLVLNKGDVGRQADRLGRMDRAIGRAALPGDRLFSAAVLLRPAMVDGPHAVGDKDVKWIAPRASGGQRIFIVPNSTLWMMTTSGLWSARAGQCGARHPGQLHHSLCPGQ
jgi:hypothetical protein